MKVQKWMEQYNKGIVTGTEVAGNIWDELKDLPKEIKDKLSDLLKMDPKKVRSFSITA